MNYTGYFLDDERFPKHVTWVNYPDNVEWKIFRSAEEFCEAIEKLDSYENVLLSFDHDLGCNPYDNYHPYPTGYDAMNRFINVLLDREFKGDLPFVSVHSMNPVGARNIKMLWESFEKNHG